MAKRVKREIIHIAVKTCKNQAVELMTGVASSGATLCGKQGILSELTSWNGNIEGRLIELPSLANHYIRFKRGDEIKLLSIEEQIAIFPKDKKMLINSIPISGCSVGADPEVFAVDDGGVIIPAFSFLPSKGEGNPYWDGFQAEFTTNPRSKGNPQCLAYHTDDVQAKLAEVWKILQKKFPGAKLTWTSVLDIPFAIMDSASEKHVELGCAPSKNAYPFVKALQVVDGRSLPIRFAGCHMHFGVGRLIADTMNRIVKMIDAIYGVASVSLFDGMEDPRRRMFYGRAGEYRTPTHGLEYRVTSSAMIAHPVLYHLCFDIARACMYLGMHIPNPHLIWDYDGDEQIVEIINTYDVKAARRLLKKNIGILEHIVKRRYGAGQASALKLLLDGAIGQLPLDDMVENWWLEGKQLKGYNYKWEMHSSATNCCVATSRLKERE
jgi:hypothetical protein